MERFVSTPSEAERVKAARAMNDIARNYVPIVPLLFRLETHYVQPWVQGFAPPVFRSYWKYLDIDVAKRNRAP